MCLVHVRQHLCTMGTSPPVYAFVKSLDVNRRVALQLNLHLFMVEVHQNLYHHIIITG